LEDDDTQVYQTELTKLLMESYDRGVADALEETKAALAQRPWVGLTDDEVYKIAFALEGEHWRKIADAIEAKLKEKNS
jgi:hypothetical protein